MKQIAELAAMEVELSKRSKSLTDAFNAYKEAKQLFDDLESDFFKKVNSKETSDFVNSVGVDAIGNYLESNGLGTDLIDYIL